MKLGQQVDGCFAVLFRHVVGKGLAYSFLEKAGDGQEGGQAGVLIGQLGQRLGRHAPAHS